MEKELFEKLKLKAQALFEATTSFGTITVDMLDQFIEQLLSFTKVNITKEEYSELRSYLESKLYVEHDHEGYVIVSEEDTDDRNWYSNSDHGEEYFWKLYKKKLILEGSLDSSSINLLGEKTIPQIMNCLGNPQDNLQEQRIRYGLVIGDVQSGKTSTYAGLICKAADAGMKVVVILAGQTESLRQQTQERMEEDIIGYTIRFDAQGGERSDRVGVGKFDKKKENEPIYKPIVTAGTSYGDDLKMSKSMMMNGIQSQSSLIIFVVKKNTTILNRLYTWLTGPNQTLNDQGKLPYSLLLLDDEADNASINTKKDKYNPTATNSWIRRICEVFMNSNYVGFTATPYANVFINPERDDAMETTDLFPKDFIYVLPTPSAYIGAMKIFGEATTDNPEYGSCNYMLKYIADIKEPTKDELKAMGDDEKRTRLLYYKHPKDWKGILPKSLLTSLRCFYLANVIRDLDGYEKSPRTMLVNISRYTNVQLYVKNEIKEQYNADYHNIYYNLTNDYETNIKIPLFKELVDIFKENFADCGHDVKEVLSKDALVDGIEKIRIVVVNKSKESKEDTPNYKTEPSLRLIAVGGLALSRGLTLRGLMTSYFYRNTATYDTLMQMGRWFGYRPGYARLCRIWITNTSANWYRDIAESTEELKNDLARMNYQNLTPKEFGLRVRNDDAALEITARNKMRTAKLQQEVLSFWGDIFETPYFSHDIYANTQNVDVTREFLQSLSDNGIQFNNSGYGSSVIAKNVPCDFVTKLLRGMHPSVALLNMRFPNTKIAEFIEENSSELNIWDIAIVGGSGGESDFTNIKTKQVLRTLSIFNENTFSFTNNGVIGGANDGRIGLSNSKDIEDEYIRKETAVGNTNPKVSRKTWFKYVQRKPILLLYLVKPKNIDKMEPALKDYVDKLGDDPIMGYAVGIPGLNHSSTEEHYYYTTIIYQQNQANDGGDNDADDDDLE